MKNVLIIGASGGIARLVTDILIDQGAVNLTLFLRKSNRLNGNVLGKCKVIEGDANDKAVLKTAMKSQDIVYINLAGDLEGMNKNIVSVMKEAGVNRVIFISSIGIYETPLKSVLQPYRRGADVIEASGLDYTVLRPEWFSSSNDIRYETTPKGTPEKGGTIARKALATLITDIINSPETFSKTNIGVNSPQ
ncbi:MAG: NAD(P)H-binding protein [Pedobacter sp.]